MKISILLFPCLFILSYKLLAQNGIKVTDGSSSAINDKVVLQIETVSEQKRGFLFPRMTYDQMLNIASPEDGLMVYVTDNSPEQSGLWFYNSFEKEWFRYQTLPSPKKPAEPYGSIVIYTGSLENFEGYGGNSTPDATIRGLGIKDTDMEGWAICNGNNKTPNLTGRFITSGFREIDKAEVTELQKDLNYAPDITQLYSTGKFGGQDQIKFNAENMPKHVHDVNTIGKSEIKHKHTLSNNTPHDHGYVYETENRNMRGDNAVTMRKGDKDGDDRNKLELQPAEKGTQPVLLPSEPPITANIVFNPVPGGSFLTYAGYENPEPFDNRPPHYSVVYIMRIKEDLTGVYNTEVKIDYR